MRLYCVLILLLTFIVLFNPPPSVSSSPKQLVLVLVDGRPCCFNNTCHCKYHYLSRLNSFPDTIGNNCTYINCTINFFFLPFTLPYILFFTVLILRFFIHCRSTPFFHIDKLFRFIVWLKITFYCVIFCLKYDIGV